jgi:hypothetical protein
VLDCDSRGVDGPNKLNGEYPPLCILERSADDEVDGEGDANFI